MSPPVIPLGTRTLPEADSKRLLAAHGVRFAAERDGRSSEDAVAESLGYPIVVKLNGEAIAHKTERGLVQLRLGDAAAVRLAADELLAAARPEDGPGQLAGRADAGRHPGADRRDGGRCQLRADRHVGARGRARGSRRRRRHPARVARQAGVVRAATVEEGFDVAATFATQPLPKGPNVAVVTTAGGWGVVTADAVAASDLSLLPFPDDPRDRVDRLVPPRWSRSNPIDCAGGETRDTIPDLLHLVAAHPSVDAVVHLGTGIRSNQAKLMRNGPFYPGHGLDRIVEYHERQDVRFARAAADASATSGKPVLTTSELAVADPTNPGPATVRAAGRGCYASSTRAVRALHHAWGHARYRQRRAG